jgi:hypothetical protein
MHRRSFLRFLLATPLASVVDYEKLLWVPGEKKIFIPPPKQLIINPGCRVIIEEIKPLTMRVPLEMRPGGMFFSSDEIPHVVTYKNISFDEAVRDKYIHPYEIPSLSDFVKRVNNES